MKKIIIIITPLLFFSKKSFSQCAVKSPKSSFDIISKSSVSYDNSIRTIFNKIKSIYNLDCNYFYYDDSESPNAAANSEDGNIYLGTTILNECIHDKERQKIDNYLKPNFYTFWRFINIFFHSGARENEMLALQAKNVDVEKHRFKILIKKGRQKREVYRTIKDIALPLWVEILKDANPEDYLFSVGLKPGPKKIIREQITRRWNVHVKKKLNISADFYSLKHLNIDETADALDIKDASEMAGRMAAYVIPCV